MRRVQRGAFLAPSLSSSFKKGSFSKQDRAFITDLSYGTLRHLRYLDACLARRLKDANKLPADIINILRLASYELLIRQTPKHAAVNEWVDVSKQKYRKLSGLVNAVLKRLEPLENLTPAIKHSIPDWLYNDWETLFGDQAANVAKSMNEAEPLWIYTYSDRAKDILEPELKSLSEGPLSKTAALQAEKPLHELTAFKQGLIGAQNPASTLPVRLLNIQKGDAVLDLASGNGIKTAQLASLGAQVTSVELHEKKLKRAENNLNRLGLKASHIAHDLKTPPELEPFNKVLLDAPCSGTGTLRGHPEIKLRLSPEDVKNLAALQKTMLETAWTLTRKGGTLIYAICALTSAESLEVIKAFLKNHNNARLLPINAETWSLPIHQTDFGSFVLPFDGLDGFFICHLEKSS